MSVGSWLSRRHLAKTFVTVSCTIAIVGLPSAECVDRADEVFDVISDPGPPGICSWYWIGSESIAGPAGISEIHRNSWWPKSVKSITDR